MVPEDARTTIGLVLEIGAILMVIPWAIWQYRIAMGFAERQRAARIEPLPPSEVDRLTPGRHEGTADPDPDPGPDPARLRLTAEMLGQRWRSARLTWFVPVIAAGLLLVRP